MKKLFHDEPIAALRQDVCNNGYTCVANWRPLAVYNLFALADISFVEMDKLYRLRESRQ